MSPAPLITLLTDFGDAGGFPAQMKGVVLGLCPEARLVDITHHIPAYDILVGQIFLRDAVAAFPPGTIHVAVVDPGVGTPRRPIVVASGAAAPGHFFVGPDNGLLWPFARDGEVFELQETKFRRSSVSATFHGRDVFSPAAAHLARGVSSADFGPRVTDAVRLAAPKVRRESGSLIGEVLYADDFGNLISNIRAEDLPDGPAPRLRVAVAGRSLNGVTRTYGDAAAGTWLALLGSSGRLEISIREGNAKSALGPGAAVRGMPVVVELSAGS